MTQSEVALKHRMIYDAVMIIRSLEWNESQLAQKLYQLEMAERKNNINEIEKLENDIKTLVNRINMEDRNMEAFKIKYKGIIADEKKKMLLNLREKK